MQTTIKIDTTKQLKNGSIFVKYDGISKKETTNQEKIQKLVADFLNDRSSHDMVENIRILRTILKDYQ